jgi:hypothetical protein
MEPLGKILSGVEERRAAQARTIAEEQRITKELEDKKIAEIEDARQKIATGEETTSRPLHDGMIVLYGAELVKYPEIVSRYEQVEEALKGKAGELVVAMNRWLESTSLCSGFGYDERESKQIVSHNITMGILSGESLIFNYEEERAYMPTSKYAASYAGRSVKSESPLEGRMLIDDVHLGFDDRPSLGWNLAEKLDLSRVDHWRRGEGSPDTQMDILIGREAIKEWLMAAGEYSDMRNGELIRMRELCKILGVKPIEPATTWQQRNLARY